MKIYVVLLLLAFSAMSIFLEFVVINFKSCPGKKPEKKSDKVKVPLLLN